MGLRAAETGFALATAHDWGVETSLRSTERNEEVVMKISSRRPLLLGLWLAALSSAPAWGEQVDCTSPKNLGEKGACKAAAQGQNELRYYIQRTQRIHQLWIMDFDKALAPAAQAQGKDEKQRVAETK